MERPGLPVCLITGFLGSGKTTLLNYILQNRFGIKAAVFVNEFGSVDVDGSLVRWSSSLDEMQVITLDNGCICCEVNADLGKQLRAVLKKQEDKTQTIDLVVIETSGVCDPAPVLATLDQLEDLAFSTHLDSVIAVVDASDVDEASGLPETSRTMALQTTAFQQLRHCDVIILNKCDLLGGLTSERVQWVEASLSKLIQGRGKVEPRILRAERAKVDLSLIMSLSAGASVAAAEEMDKLNEERVHKRPRILEKAPGAKKTNFCQSFSSHAGALRTAARSFTYIANRPFDPMRFEEWLEAGPPRSVCRAKGLLWMKGIPRHVIFQLAGRRTNPFETVEIAGSECPSSSRLVFIGAAAELREEDEAQVRSALDRCLS